jgi:sugar lactone lactonase YvrE
LFSCLIQTFLRFRGISAAVAVAVFLVSVCFPIHAQGAASIQFQMPVPLITSPTPSPYGVALDKSGNLFISDFYYNRVLEIPAGCQTAACEVTLPTSGLDHPFGLALDANGDVFIADYSNNRVVEIPWTGTAFGAQAVLPSTGQNFPSGVAVDANGDVFIANYDNQNSPPTPSLVVELPWNGTSYGAPVTVVNWLSGPFGLAFDAAGDLYIANFPNGQIVELPKGCSASTCQVTVATGLVNPTAVAVDQNGNVFAADYYGNQVVEIPSGCATSACWIQIGNGLAYPAGVAVDDAGNIFIADYTNKRVLRVRQNSFDLGTVSVGATATVAAYVTFNSAVTLNSTSPYSVFTQGVTGLDFIDGGSSTCSGTSYTAGQSCLVNIAFGPRFAGSAQGALLLADTSGNAVVTGFVSGIGSAPQLTFRPGAQSSVGSGLSSSAGVAIDRQGNIFVADPVNHAVEELVAPGYATTRTLGGSFSFNKPLGVAVDGAGNVFVADTGATAIEEIVAPAYNTVNAIGNGLSSPSAVAVDGSGNIYVAETGNNVVKEILEAGGYTKIVTLATGFSAPAGIAVDSAGDVFVADTGNNAVKEIVAVNGIISSSPTINAIGAGLSAPGGVALDGMGNLYIADTGSGAVDEITAASGYATQTQLAGNLGGPTGLAVDSSGNVYVGSPSSAQVVKFDYADPPTLTFVAGAGSTSTPQSATVVNSGNADLTFAVPTTGYNPSVSADFTLETNESTGTPCPILTPTSGAATLASGASCIDQLTFSPPTGGAVSGSLVMTDDDLNVAGSTQTIQLNGNSIVLTFAPATLVSGQVGVSYNQTLTVTGGTAPYSYQVTAGSLPAGLALNSAGTLSGTPTAAGSFSFTATATDTNGISGNQQYTLTISAPPITLSPSTLPSAQVNLAYSQTLTATGGTAPYQFAVTGSLPGGITFNAATATFSGTATAGGSFPISVTVTDSSTGSGPYTTTVNYTLVVNPGTATLTFAPVPPQTYGNPPFTVTASSASTGAITYSILSGPGTINSSTGSVTLSGAGTLTIQAQQAATASYNSTIAQMPMSIAKQNSTTKLTASASSVSPGQSVTFTATVAAAVTGSPTGTISFFDGTTQIGTAVALSNGSAQLTASNLSSGQNNISAVYSGDTNFLSSSFALASPIVVAPADFTFTATGSTSQTVIPGGTATFTFALSPTGASYPDTVTFSMKGLPAGANATTSATSVSSTAGPQTITLTIKAPTSSSADNVPQGPGRRNAPLVFAVLLPLLGISGLRRRRWGFRGAIRLMVLLTAGILVTWSVSGCGGNVSGVLGRSYSISVTAASGSVQHTAFVDVTVK